MDRSMDLQMFGTVQTPQGEATAMLCRDFDLPDEAVLHWWRDDVKRAILVDMTPSADGIALRLKGLFRVNERGGIWLPFPLEAEEVEFMRSTHATVKLQGDSLVGQWQNNSGGGAIALHPRTRVGPITPAVCHTWREFKDWANDARQSNNIAFFRGHGSNQFSLQTSLHRAGLTRIERYVSGMLLEFRAQVETLLGFRIDTQDGQDFSMLLGLAQHHGLPSPLLDWTRSPYVAAFFAFADAIDHQSTRPEATHVRVYGLNRDFTTKFYSQNVQLPLFAPYVSPLSITARNNPRLHAQQGEFLVTNVQDVESFIIHLEGIYAARYLVAADIPVAEAYEALEDLNYMGLSAATMFPGLDGVGRALRYSMGFKRRQPSSGMPESPKPSGS